MEFSYKTIYSYIVFICTFLYLFNNQYNLQSTTYLCKLVNANKILWIHVLPKLKKRKLIKCVISALRNSYYHHNKRFLLFYFLEN